MSRQGKMRLSKWYNPTTSTSRLQTIREVSQTVLTRSPKMCNIVKFHNKTRIVYKRYASLYFIACIDPEENELLTMELLHMYVEILNEYFGAVCELDLIFNFERAYWILDELVVCGEIQEVDRKEIVRVARDADRLAEKKPEFREEDAVRKNARGSVKYHSHR